MKNDNWTWKEIICTLLIGFVILVGIVTCEMSVSKSILEDKGYHVIEYVRGSYKVYDKNTKVMYMFSDKTSVFTPIYNSDGSLMIYEE